MPQPTRPFLCRSRPPPCHRPRSARGFPLSAQERWSIAAVTATLLALRAAHERSSPKAELELCDDGRETPAVLASGEMPSNLGHLGCRGFSVEHERQRPASQTARPAVDLVLNWFRYVPVSAALRSRAAEAGAGRATSRSAARLFSTWSSAPREPRVNESQRGRARLAPGVAGERRRSSSTDESRRSPLVEFDIRSDHTTAELTNFFHLMTRTSTCARAPACLRARRSPSTPPRSVSTIPAGAPRATGYPEASDEGVNSTNQTASAAAASRMKISAAKSGSKLTWDMNWITLRPVISSTASLNCSPSPSGRLAGCT